MLIKTNHHKGDRRYLRAEVQRLLQYLHYMVQFMLHIAALHRVCKVLVLISQFPIYCTTFGHATLCVCK